MKLGNLQVPNLPPDFPMEGNRSANTGCRKKCDNFYVPDFYTTS